MSDEELKKRFAACLAKAQNGDADAMVEVGYCCEKGIGTDKDEKQGARWAMLAAGLGQAHGMSNLARYYESGIGIGQDQDRANFWYRKAALMGDAEAVASLGCNYSSGRKLPRDWAMACKLWRLAVDAGVMWPALYVAECYMLGKGTLRVDLALARKYFEQVDSNSSIFDQDDYDAFKEELEAREEQAKRGGTLEAEPEETWRDVQNAEEIPDPEVRSWELEFLDDRAGKMFETSVDSEEDNDKLLALEYTLALAERGSVCMMANAGWLYEIGWGVAADMQKAIKWSMRGAKAGNATACTHLGRYFEDGKGVEADLTRGFKLYKKAVELSENHIDNELAKRLCGCYLYGRGTRRNIKSARRWFEYIEDSDRDDYLKLAADLEVEEKRMELKKK